MIYGVGCDLVTISRISKCKDNFKKRYFSENEQRLFAQKGEDAKTIAANFAAKEAFAKALGTGIRGFSLCEVEVLRDGLGKPYINLLGKAKEIIGDGKTKNIFVSLSHEGDLALAYVIIEEVDE